MDCQKILIVDDAETMLMLLEEFFASEGFAVETAGSGEEALEKSRSTPYPLVITDIQMGGISGLQLLAQLRREAPETRVILMSSELSREVAAEAKELGVCAVWSKPFEDLEALVPVVRGVLEGR